MRNDFDVFAESDSDEPVIDSDIALISAFLSGELSQVQIVAVQERLVSDRAFREKVQPLVEAWTLPVSWDASAESAARLRDRQLAALTPMEIESGWRRHLEGGDERDKPTPIAPAAAVRDLASQRKTNMTRIAATVALIALPIALSAQLLTYAASHANAPGHSFARALLSVGHRETPVDESAGESQMNRVDFIGDDGPAQIPMLGNSAPAQQRIPVVELSAPTARTAEPIGAVLGLKEAADGSVLINDVGRRQLLLFQQSLLKSTIVLDSSAGSARSYGNTRTPLRPYVGDSSIFSDYRIPDAFLVITDAGNIARTLAVSTLDRNQLQSVFSGASGVDAQGRLVYKYTPGGKSVPIPGARPPISPPGAGAGSSRGGAAGGRAAGVPTTLIERTDTLQIVRIDLVVRRTDTVGYILQGRDNAALPGGGRMALVPGKNGASDSVKQLVNPLLVVDDWAVLSDGTIALVRGADYHVDWIHPDGSKSSSPKLPYDWHMLSRNDLRRIVDSTRRSIDSLDAIGAAYSDSLLAAGGRVGRNGVVTAAAPARVGGATGAPARSGRAAAGNVMPLPAIADGRGVRQGLVANPSPRSRRQFPYEIVPIEQLPDHIPPIFVGAAMPDRDGNLWILPRTTAQSKNGELVYDMVNPKNGLVRRVRLPVGRSIAGFGKGGVVYLQVGDVTKGFFIERRKLPN